MVTTMTSKDANILSIVKETNVIRWSRTKNTLRTIGLGFRMIVTKYSIVRIVLLFTFWINALPQLELLENILEAF